MAKRVLWVDITRAIAIFLVVLGHLNNVADYGQLERIIYTFHMPLFFMISGFFIKVEKTYDRKTWWNKCIKKYLICLIIPYFIWALIYMKNFIFAPYLLYGSWLSIKASTTYTCYWFLPCLFVARIYEFAAFTIANKCKINANVMAAICCVVFMAIGLLLPANNADDKLGLFCSFNIAFVACSFMFFGFLIKQFLDKIKDKIAVTLPAFIVSVVLFVFIYINFVSYQGQFDFMMMCNSYYGPIPVFIAEAVVGSLMIIFLSMLLAKIPIKWKLMSWLGANTMGIYVIHKKVAEQLYAQYLSMHADISVYVSSVIIALVTMAIAAAITWVINKYAPALFGKIRKR